jgi:hypothetical protein
MRRLELFEGPIAFEKLNMKFTMAIRFKLWVDYV